MCAGVTMFYTVNRDTFRANAVAIRFFGSINSYVRDGEYDLRKYEWIPLAKWSTEWKSIKHEEIDNYFNIDYKIYIRSMQIKKFFIILYNII